MPSWQSAMLRPRHIKARDGLRIHAPLRRLGVAIVLIGCASGETIAQPFVEVGLSAGLADAVHSTGLSAADYDGDGDLDIYVVSASQHDDQDPGTWNRLYRNNGNGTYTDVADAAGVRAAHVRGWYNSHMGNRFSAAWADYDRDGDPDLLLTQVGPETLYENLGDGTFADVTLESGINLGVPADDSTETVGATWWDYDRDGYLDVYLNNWRTNNRLYRNLGDGHFESVADELAIADSGRTWTAMPHDYNADGIPDLYLANDFGPNRLYLGMSGGGFRDATSEYRVGDNGHGMGVALGDVNGDLRADLYVTNISELYPNPLYMGLPQPPFEEVAAFVGIHDANWGWGTEFFDADLDGDLDLYAANGFILELDTPNRFWRNRLREDGAVRFDNRSAESGADDLAESRAVLVLDHDGDGDLDILVATWNDRVKLYQNQVSPGKHLSVRLRGATSNPHGFGAVVRARTGDWNQIRVNDGVDIFGQSVVPIHFGLGSATRVDTLEVTWPSGLVQVVADVAANTVLDLEEGTVALGSEPLAERVVLPIEVYPNPTRDRIRIRRSLAAPGRVSVAVTVSDVLGRQLLRRAMDASETDLVLDLGQYPAGTYLVRLTENGTVSTSVVVRF